jgi:serpin B
MKKSLFLLAASIMLLGLSGCTQDDQLQQPDIPINTSQTDSEVLVDGNNAFAFYLYQTLSQEEGNLFFSPYSISEALTMAYAGARGDTEKDMAEVLNFNLPQERLHPAFNATDLQLEERSQVLGDKEGFQLNVVNAIWGQQGYHFLDEYLDVLTQYYGAGLRLVDFISETEQSRIAINQWVSDQTEGKIKDLIPQGTINKITRLVLTNAVYFNANWQYPFDTRNTAAGLFYLLDGSCVTVPMMRQSDSFGYTEGANYQAVELLYEGRETSMVILLPAAGQFDNFEESLDADLVEDIIIDLEKRRVALKMPMFEYESSFQLNQALSTMGMGVAFTTQADFSGMNGGYEPLWISDVLHKAFISVNESGTEAAAASAITMPPSATSPPQPKELTIDRPFIFLIRDIPTGSTIFIGRVLNPTAQ